MSMNASGMEMGIPQRKTEVYNPSPSESKEGKEKIKEAFFAYGQQFKIFTFNMFEDNGIFNQNILTGVTKANLPTLKPANFFAGKGINFSELSDHTKQQIEIIYRKLEDATNGKGKLSFAEIGKEMILLAQTESGKVILEKENLEK